MECRHLFASHQQQRFRFVQRQTFVENTGELCLLQFRQRRAADFCPVKQALIGGVSDGQVPILGQQREPKVLGRVVHSHL